MNRIRWIAVACIALGLMGVSLALGCLYRDVVAMDKAIAEIKQGPAKGESSQVPEAVFAKWQDPADFTRALISGTLGVALLGAGVSIQVFQSRPFNRRLDEPGQPR